MVINYFLNYSLSYLTFPSSIKSKKTTFHILQANKIIKDKQNHTMTFMSN